VQNENCPQIQAKQGILKRVQNDGEKNKKSKDTASSAV